MRRRRRGKERSAYFLLSIPELGAFFLAHGSGAATTLRPVSDDPPLRFKGEPLQAGRPHPVYEVLSVLREAALRFADSASVRSDPQRERPNPLKPQG